MIALGLILLVVGLLLPQLSVLVTIGIILLVVGAILWFLPTATGRTYGPGIYRGRYW